MSFSDKKIQDVWAKGTIIRGESPDLYRKDAKGALMFFHSYGKQSPMGWEIDHIKPLSKGGSDDISNLQPLHWENNRAKGDKYPY